MMDHNDKCIPLDRVNYNFFLMGYRKKYISWPYLEEKKRELVTPLSSPDV